MPDLKKYKMFINGEWVDSESKKTFKSLNPENNEPWAEVPEASEKDVDKAVKAAQEAFEGSWPKLFPKERLCIASRIDVFPDPFSPQIMVIPGPKDILVFSWFLKEIILILLISTDFFVSTINSNWH